MGESTTVRVRTFKAADQQGVLDLWHACGVTRPWNDPAKDIRRKLRVQRDMFLVGELGGEIVGSVMAGYDGHRGWIYYLAVSPPLRQQGYGRMLMEHAERCLKERGCPKINVLVRTDNEDVIAFYRRLGYAVDAVVGLGKRLETDRPGQSD